jgi:hypothetical protein
MKNYKESRELWFYYNFVFINIVTTVPKTDTGSLVENTKALSEKFLRNSAKTPHKFDDKGDLLDTKFF